MAYCNLKSVACSLANIVNRLLLGLICLILVVTSQRSCFKHLMPSKLGNTTPTDLVRVMTIACIAALPFTVVILAFAMIEFAGLAKQHGAINIGQGFPDYSSTPSHLTEGLAKAVVGQENVLINQYTRGFGHPRLVSNLAKLYGWSLNRQVDDLNEILVTIGAYQALFYAVFALIDKGDEAIIFEPYYDCYEPQVRMAGGIPVFVPMRLNKHEGVLSSADLQIDFDLLEKKVSGRTKIIFLNNPHNPTGKLFSREELERVADVARRHNLIVIADEVYEWLVYEPHEMIRFGWAVALAPLIRLLQAVHQNCVYTCPTPIQEAIGAGFDVELPLLGTGHSYFEQVANELRPKRDRMAAFLTEIGMSPIVPEAGYFMLCDTSLLNGRFTSDATEPKDYKLVKWLCKEKKVAGIPCSAFYSATSKQLGEDWIRFCFFKKEETFDKAEAILRAWAKEERNA